MGLFCLKTAKIQARKAVITISKYKKNVLENEKLLFPLCTKEKTKEIYVPQRIIHKSNKEAILYPI